MRAWLESIAGPQYASAMIWTLGALILLLVILVVIRIIRGLTFGTFVAGGRNRKTRLAVMDAAAVDSHRRLVLVRRDDIEHLLLIGGPTDVVVEQNIRLTTPVRRPLPPEPRDRPAADDFPTRQAPESLKHPAAAEPPPEPARRPAEPARPQAAAPAAVSPTASAPTPSRSSAYSPRPVTPPTRPATPALAAGAAPASASPASSAPAASAESPAAPVSGKRGELDDALLKELEVTLNEKTPPVEPAGKAPKEDDEMSRLLGDLSAHRDK